MRIDDARVLKDQLLVEARTELVPADVRPVAVAVGICPLGGDEYGLAVRHSAESAAVRPFLDRARELAGGACDVRYVGGIYSLSWNADDLQKRARPLRPGVSIAHHDVTAGTLGAFVVPRDDPDDDRIQVLSNNHVLANSDHGLAGDVVLQPGPADDGTDPADRVGVLDRIAPLQRDASNVVDAATARLDDGVEIDDVYPSGAIITWSDIVASSEVEKVGRTTGRTAGRVSAFEVDGLVIQFPDGPLEFHGQIEVAGDASGPFSAGGDSGSLVYQPAQLDALGLLFAGSEQGGPGGFGLTYCNPIGAVLDALGVRLAGSVDDSRDRRPL
ncbi:hypothetical protein [Phytoactinopolyspora mesophila]|uniref:Trypsin-like serine protease n=1 Tax=Phytoactinopolyspora mesophila TaxID=2650750 RepID=A0A7K3M1C7_9ACTN|nr:hypothetical protein [Phytoactinopolyspora mesophila]NDL57105.1 hypothetical protein [Phytoactinopolyspora mesophila]